MLAIAFCRLNIYGLLEVSENHIGYLQEVGKMVKHKPVCITLTVEEAIEAKKLAASSGVSLSEWFGNLVRAKSTHKFTPRNSTGRPISE